MSASASTAISAVASTSKSNDQPKLSFAHDKVKSLSAFRMSKPFEARLVDQAQAYQKRMDENPSHYSKYAQRAADDLAHTFLAWVEEHEQSTADLSITNVYNNGPSDACPPFDFVWTDSYILAPDVPPSDENELEGCDCDDDVCNPATCKCMDRAVRMDYFNDYDPLKFAYMFDEKDPNTKVLHSSGLCAIWECNKKCRCSKNCINRVVQQGRKYGIDFCKTQECGWGVRARDRIPQGAFIGVYSGELITNEEAEHRDLLYEKVKTTYVFDLDSEIIRMDCIKQQIKRKLEEQGDFDQLDEDSLRAHMRRAVELIKLANKYHDDAQMFENDVKKAKFKKYWTEAWEAERLKQHKAWEAAQKETPNTFLSLSEQDKDEALAWERWDEDRIRNSQLSVDGGLCGNFTRFFNHSCQGNLFITSVYINEPSPHRPFLAFFTARNIEPGEELTFDYVNVFGANEGQLEELSVAKAKELDERVKENEEEEGTRAMRCRCGAPKCKRWVWRKKQ